MSEHDVQSRAPLADDAGHRQWRAEQMSRLGEGDEGVESYSSWRDDACRKRWQATQQHQDAALSYMKTLISA